MSISKEEHCLLVFDAQLQVQCFQVFTEVGLTVSSAESYLKHLGQAYSTDSNTFLICALNVILNSFILYP